jgi:menaquinone-dependent protoporphyrinogen oxidase
MRCTETSKGSRYNYMATILIVYSSTDGQTKKICQKLQEVIERQAHQVKMTAIEDVQQIDLTSFDKIVIGASIRYGKHSPLIIDFIKKNERILTEKSNTFFSVNVVARKPEKNQPDTNPYLQKFLKQISWQPKKLAVFAGKIDYPRYSFFDRLFIQLIMLMTKGPTDPEAMVEFTDWQKVEAFGHVITAM